MGRERRIGILLSGNIAAQYQEKCHVRALSAKAAYRTQQCAKRRSRCREPSPARGGSMNAGDAKHRLRSSGWGGRFPPNATAVLHRHWLRIASAIKFDVNTLEHGWQFFGNVGVPETHDAIAFCFQPLLPLQVTDGLTVFVVMTAIEFKNEVGGGTKEVDDIRTNGRLPSKMRTNKRHLFQRSPQDTLMQRRIATEPLCGCTTER
jgi:hypothetical protein